MIDFAGIFHSRRCANLVCILGAVLAGCSGQQVQQKLEPTERAVQPTVGAIECGGGSVKATIASCRAEGGHYGHCALVASRAGVSGATACYTYANAIRQRREELVGQEDQLDAQIHYLQDVNRDTMKLNAELSVRVDEATSRTDTALDSLHQGEMTDAELDQLKAILEIEVSSARRQLDAASRELQVADQYRSRQESSTAALNAEISHLQALVEEARRQTSALVAQRQRI